MLKAFNTCSYRRAGSRSPVLAALIIRYAIEWELNQLANRLEAQG
jgi:hypothetical protein